jgi:hypothetical protein
MTDQKVNRLVAICTVLFLVLCVAAFVYLAQMVECPFCHAGNVDANGRCNLGDRCGNYQGFPQWSEWPEERRKVYTGNPGHFRAGTCWWCNGSGRMSRLDILLD